MGSMGWLWLLVGATFGQVGGPDFDAAFARLPCADGWAGCGASGGDGLAADLRLDWFALAPTAAFDPFEARRLVAPDGPGTRPVPVEAPAPAAAVRVVAPPPPRVAPATPVEAVVEAVVAAPEAGCDPVALMKQAGQLGAGERACLDGARRGAERMTTRRDASRVLVADLRAQGDDGWVEAARLHLGSIDASDPDMAFLMLQEAELGPRERLQLAELAMANRTVWTGSTYQRRTLRLYRWRAEAAARLWQQAESTHAGTPGSGTAQAADDRRTDAKVLAREYVEYALQAGAEVEVARSLCASVAGHGGYCP